MSAGISFFMVSSSDLKYKTHETCDFQPITFLDCSRTDFMYLYEIKKNSVWYNFYQGTSVSITFYIFEHYQLWMMDSTAQRVFFPKTPKLCVWHTEVRRCYHFKLVSHFQLWFPIWGVLVNRFNLPVILIEIPVEHLPGVFSNEIQMISMTWNEWFQIKIPTQELKGWQFCNFLQDFLQRCEIDFFP